MNLANSFVEQKKKLQNKPRNTKFQKLYNKNTQFVIIY